MAQFPQGLTQIDQRCNTGERRVLHHFFPLVLVAGLQVMPMKDESAEDAARLLYVAKTRATRELVLSTHAETPLVQRVRQALSVVSQRFAQP